MFAQSLLLPSCVGVTTSNILSLESDFFFEELYFSGGRLTLTFSFRLLQFGDNRKTIRFFGTGVKEGM